MILKQPFDTSFELFLILLTFTCQPWAKPQSSNTNYQTPLQFMDLYFDFTGAYDKDYPKSKVNASQALIQSMQERTQDNDAHGPLLLFLDSTLYVYSDSGDKLLEMSLRANRENGFYEMTSLSHVGPALAYYAQAKDNGSNSWRAGLEAIQKHLSDIKALNNQPQNNWLNSVKAPSWQPFKKDIHAMVDYACSMAGNYIKTVLKNEHFNRRSLVIDLYQNTSEAYPISYNHVMVATFMLTALEAIDSITKNLSGLHLDWANAKVIVRNLVGTNVTAGLTAQNNWIIPLLNAVSSGQLPSDRVFIAPYAEIKSSVGQDKLPSETLDYYKNQIWTNTYDRSKIAKSVFSYIPSMYAAKDIALPGDYSVTQANNIYDFILRLKYSLENPTEMLSNTVAFWMAGEYQQKKGDLNTILVPGLTTGLPEGLSSYPDHNPEV